MGSASPSVAALANLIPNSRSPTASSPVRSRRLALTYRDVVPTPLGGAISTYYVIALAVLGMRTLRDPGPGGRAQGVALLLLAATALHDTVVYSFALAAPYLLSLGFLAVIVGVGVSVVARFVQNARALETALRALRDTREALVRQERLAALGEMSAMVAHEVRNPLAVMFNVLATVRRGPLDEQQSMLLKIIDEEARRLQRLVTDLLDFSRPGALRRSRVEVLRAGRHRRRRRPRGRRRPLPDACPHPSPSRRTSPGSTSTPSSAAARSSTSSTTPSARLAAAPFG